MVRRPQRLSLSRSVVLNSSGEGTISVGPSMYREVWNVRRITTNGTSAADPDLYVYRGAAGPNLLDTTARGNQDISETSLRVLAGESLTFHYRLGTAGALMTVYLEGEITHGI